ncbi:NAD(P)/FAD-dependent oxidoreductase [Marivirga sp.]|uniref:NAD(P)/FAD-dependent oxidoreductase n=1 Tax=Marivirga sp. TaxID=2018662 RepID=UPI002D7FE2B0|nr:NAD(P)/FAD-dependent oxidoreductase [Marivirga sp.]HET8860588.1 NAD(P)/FAD-dependent oxidoreductase [Marivirga sp.]
MEEDKVIIIGAGLAGLTAAIELERAGFTPTIFEASDSIGGRVKTDKSEGFLLDHGFQVLLTAYPEAQKYLDYDKLKLKKFSAGALILDKSKGNYTIADPLKEPLTAFKMLTSRVGSFSDKLKIFSWTQELKKNSIEAIFKRKEISSLEFLKNKGFSEHIINEFFKPFFGGIFLENELNTSSRMLEFVFKMFSEGYAAIPEDGMGAIPKQLESQLTQTKIKLNSRVAEVGLKKIVLENGDLFEANAIVVATKAGELLPQLQGQFAGDQFVTNLLFSSNIPPFKESLIALVPDKDYIINNIAIMDNVAPNYSPEGSSLISISVTDNYTENEKSLKKRVLDELISLFPELKNATIGHIKNFYIDNALPIIHDFQYSLKPSETKIQDGVYLAGDYLLNGSINAAMLSGRLAAQAIYEDLKGKGFRN